MINRINPKKVITGAVAGIVGVVLVFGSFFVVDETEEAVVTRLGEQNRIASAGLNFKIPIIESIDRMPIGIRVLELNDLTIPTRENPNQPASANVTIRYSVIPGMSGKIRAKHGTIENYIYNQTRQDLLSMLRDKGREIKDTRTLLGGTTLAEMQGELKEEIGSNASAEGVRIDAVLIQNAVPHAREAQRMDATRDRQEREQQALSEARTKETQDRMRIATEQAKADAEAVANKAKIARATADKQAAILKAQGEAESIKLVAEANIELDKSLTPAILAKMDKDNEAILYGKSTGQVPHTIIGETDLRAIGVPVATGK